MKRFILISAVFELLAGILLFLIPDLVPNFIDDSALSVGLARMYGGAAFSIGIYLLLAWRSPLDSAALRRIMIFLLCFNVLVAIAIFIGADQGGFSDIKPAITHSILGAVALYFLIANRASTTD